MKLFHLSVFLICCIPLVANSSPKNYVECGKEWINIHKNNKNLIGVYVQQYPDSIPDRSYYKGKHPAAIFYVFKNDVSHSVFYSPSGQVQTGLWGKIKKDHWLYKMITKDLNLEKQCAHWIKSK